MDYTYLRNSDQYAGIYCITYSFYIYLYVLYFHVFVLLNIYMYVYVKEISTQAVIRR